MIKRIFIRGLLTIAPLVITIEIIVWLYKDIESVVGGMYVRWVGETYYFPGLGVLIGILAILLVGILVNNWVIRKLFKGLEKLIDKIPFVKILYRCLLDLMNFFKGSEKMGQKRVVVVKWGTTKLMGLVSRETYEDLPKGIGEEGEVTVYLPMSYQIGGMMVIVPKSMVTPVDMDVEESVRFVVTAGMPGQTNEEEGAREPAK